MHAAIETFEQALTAALHRWGLPIECDRLRLLRSHYEAVMEANRSVNLTRITERAEAAVKHYADSLALLLWVRNRMTPVAAVLDVGTGAGFPAVPLAAMRPDWAVTAIDATRKKVDFLRRTAAVLGLHNLQCEHAHSTQWRSAGSAFDVVVFRALTSFAESLEQTVRHVSPGGWLVAYKVAAVPRAELQAAERVASTRKLRLVERFEYDLEYGGTRIQRVLFVFQK